MNGLKVLFHINELSRWQIVLGNITNLLNDVGQDNAHIEVVINGEAVSIFKDKCKQVESGNLCSISSNLSLLEQMEELSKIGVKFVACRNALKGQSIDENSLPDFVTVVPVGITEIVRKQAEGYAYIKP
ncbi:MULTISPECIES: DsrE family protein [Caldicellulosiruptor]|uniref:DsrE family protein n=1 Tax=Caldicellulosiruptor TaxID=44000 RepID=UPI00005E5D16|nr:MULTISPECIES: DsrE family protein [Caldicellulosiruptor]